MLNYRKLISIRAAEAEQVENPQWINILNAGHWDTNYQGSFDVDIHDLDEMVMNFKSGIRKGVPIDTDHDNKGANGWVTQLEIRNASELWALVEWTPLGMEKLANKIYKFLSPEFCPAYFDPETDRFLCNNVLIAAALTNFPLMKGLQAVTASENLKENTIYLNEDPEEKEKKMAKEKTEEIKAEEVIIKEVVTDDAEIVVEKADEVVETLADEEKTSENVQNEDEIQADEKSEEENEEKTDEGDKPVVDEEKADEESENESEEEKSGVVEASEFKLNPEIMKGKGAPTKIKATDGTITDINADKKEDKIEAIEGEVVSISASELQSLRAAQETLKERDTELDKIAATEKISTLCFSEKSFKMPTESKDAVVALYLKMSEPMRDEFVAILEKIPTAKIFSEVGDAGEIADGKSAYEALGIKANEILANSNGKMNYGQALQAARKADPENAKLASEYKVKTKEGK
jgi:hypothetical protein